MNVIYNFFPAPLNSITIFSSDVAVVAAVAMFATAIYAIVFVIAGAAVPAVIVIVVILPVVVPVIVVNKLTGSC